MLNRQQAPEAFMLADLSLNKPKLKQLKNGLNVHILADSTNPVLKIDVLFNSGKVNDKLPGQSLICSKMLTEGTKSYPDGEFQEILDHYGAHLDVAIDFDSTTVSLLCLKEYANLLLPVLKSVLTEPIFAPQDFEKIKLQQLQKLRVNNQKNALIATKKLRNQLLKGTPYAVNLEEEDLAKLSLDHIKDYYETYFSLKPQLIIAGDFDESVFGNLEELFGIFEFKESVDSYKGQITPDFSEQIIEKPGSVQASIRMGALSIPKTDPNYHQLSVVNEILGGYFGSRLMKNIREDKGYTYGIYSVLINYKHLDYHIIGADVKIEHVDDAVKEVYKEIDRLKSETVSEEELETVKNYMLGKIAGNLDTIFHQAENFKVKLSEGADYIDYFEAYVKTIRNITADKVLEMSKKYFSNEYCVIKVI